MDSITTIYCDFDGTITKKDAVNTFFELFADPSWTDSEKLWVEGKISSKENAIRQVALIRETTQKELDDYIKNIEIDEDFVDFIKYIKSKNIRFVILSDGFDLFIEKTLENHNIDGVEFYSNHLVYENNKFKIEFPNHNSKCDIGAGMCKCSKIKESKFCYIGDGTSDLCVAQKADLLFATKSLKSYCEENGIKHYPFNSFRDIKKIIEKISGE